MLQNREDQRIPQLFVNGELIGGAEELESSMGASVAAWGFNLVPNDYPVTGFRLQGFSCLIQK